MKQTIALFATAIIFASCSNSNNPTPNDPNNPAITAHWIPNWSNDTLVALYQETNGGAMKYDSIFSYSRGDTSLIKYKGIEYYLWTKPSDQIQTNNPNWFIVNGQTYSFCYIGLTPFNNSSALTGSSMMGAMPHSYQNSNGQIQTQHQSLLVNPRKPPFPNNYFTGGDLFSTSNK